MTKALWERKRGRGRRNYSAVNT